MRPELNSVIIYLLLLLLPVGLQAGCPTTDVILSTQAEVDAFPATYAGCDTFYGKIEISGLSITNLNGLISMKHIGILNISNTSLIDLDGLNNIRSLGWLDIYSNSLLLSLVGLDSLTIASSIQLTHNSLLSDISALSSVEKLNDLTIGADTSLFSLEGLDSLIYCKHISIYGCDKLVDITAFLKLNTIEQLYIVGNKALINLVGFNHVDSIGGFYLIDNQSLIDLTGLNSLQTLDFIQINSNPSLINFNGLNNLSQISTLNVQGNLNLMDINALSPALKVLMNITLHGNDKLSCCLIVKKIFENNPAILSSSHISNNDTGCDSIPEVMALTPTSMCCISTYTTVSKTICQGESWTVGGNTYTVSGTYYDTVAIGASCDSIIVTNLTVLPKYLLVQNRSLCTGQTFTLNDGRVISSNGTYFDTLQTSLGCDSILEYRLSFLNNITFTQDPVICAGGSFILPDGSFASAPGTYRDTLTASFGCDSIVITNLSVNPYPQSAQSVSICPGGNYTLPGGSVVSAAGTYRDTLTTASGCDSIVVTDIIFTAYPASSRFDTVCQGQVFILPGGQQVSVGGAYNDTLTTISGCDSIVTTNLFIKANDFRVSLPSVDSIIRGQSLQLQPEYENGTAVSWQWSPDAYLSCADCEAPFANPVQSTYYTVTASSDQGCPDTASIRMIVRDPGVYVPGAFSPNGDGLNDEFGFFSVGVQSQNFSVYNRWGEQLFYTSQPGETWDGKYKGDFVPIDDYFYVIDAVMSDGSSINQSGSVIVLR